MEQINWMNVVAIAISVLTLAGTLYVNFFKAKKESAETDKILGADTSKTYSEAAKNVAEQNIELLERIQRMSDRIDILEKCRDDYEDRIRDLEKSLEEKEIEIKQLGRMIGLKDIEVLSLRKQINAKDLTIESLEERVKELEEKVKELKARNED